MKRVAVRGAGIPSVAAAALLGFSPQTGADLYSLLVCTAFPARATRLSHGNVGRIAARHGGVSRR